MKTPGSRSGSSSPPRGTITRIAAKRKPPASPAEKLAAAGIDLPQLLTELQQLSPVNASRVVKLHDRIDTGEYEIDTRRVAQKLLDLEKSLDD